MRRQVSPLFFPGRSSTLKAIATAAPQLALVVLLGLGAHVSKNALAPAQPELERLGLRPIQYAAVAAMPVIGTIVFPFFWGMAYERCERIVLILVPAGILLGQAMLLVGLQLHVIGSSQLLVKWVLVLGLVVLSASRGGGEIVQHVILVRLLPSVENLTNAFVILIFVTHFTLVLCNWAVPRLIQDGSGWSGIIHGQLVFSLPSILSVLAACCLARLTATSGALGLDAGEPLLFVANRACNNDRSGATVVIDAPVTEAPMEASISCTSKARPLSLPPQSFSKDLAVDKSKSTPRRATLPPQCLFNELAVETPVARHLLTPTSWERKEQPWLGTVSLVIWGALMIGLLHAFQSVTNKYLVSWGMSAADAGSIVAMNQIVALAFLPFVGMLTNVMGHRLLLVLTSSLTLCASIALSLGSEKVGTQAFYAGLLVFAIGGVVAPVLPLALIPVNSRALGKSYGMLDSLKSLMQVTNMLLFGALRELEHGGFHYVMMLLTLELGIATLVSATLMRTLVEP